MKFLFTLFSLLLMISCVSQKTNENAINNNTLNNVFLDVRYEARTRGSFKLIHVLENTVTYKTQKGNKIIALTLGDKKELQEAITKIDLEAIKYLKSPTNKRAFDGAVPATVIIKRGEKEYRSANFDDGYPPIELQSLVNVLMNKIK